MGKLAKQGIFGRAGIIIEVSGLTSLSLTLRHLVLSLWGIFPSGRFEPSPDWEGLGLFLSKHEG